MNAIITYSLRMRALMVAFFVLVMIAGGVAFTRLLCVSLISVPCPPPGHSSDVAVARFKEELKRVL
jgi:hypothetical protein